MYSRQLAIYDIIFEGENCCGQLASYVANLRVHWKMFCRHELMDLVVVSEKDLGSFWLVTKLKFMKLYSLKYLAKQLASLPTAIYMQLVRLFLYSKNMIIIIAKYIAIANQLHVAVSEFNSLYLPMQCCINCTCVVVQQLVCQLQLQYRDLLGVAVCVCGLISQTTTPKQDNRISMI